MTPIMHDVNLSRHDDLYQILVELHDGRTEEESRKINAKLIIAMMNQIGDPDVLTEIFALVRHSTDKYRSSFDLTDTGQ